MADIEDTISLKRLIAIQKFADKTGIPVKDLLALSKDGPVLGEDIPPKVSPEHRSYDTSRTDFSLLGDPGNKANLPAVLEKQPASNVPPKVPKEFAKEIVDEGKYLADLRGGGGQNLPAVVAGAAKAETPAIEQSVAAATKGLSGKTKALAAAGAAAVASIAYLANNKSADTPQPLTPASSTTKTPDSQPTPTAPSVKPDDKATSLLEEQAKFKQLQKMYAMPTGNLPKEQVAAISKKYETESANIASELATAKQEYQAGKDRLGNAALIDSLGKGLAQLMAGLYGVNTGRDAVTGVDFKPKDWSSSFALLQRDYSQRASELKDTRKEIESAKEKDLSFAERQAARTAQESGTAARFAIQDISQEKKQTEAESRAEQKLIAKEAEEADKKKKAEQSLIKNARAEIEGLKRFLKTGDKKTIQKQEEVTAEALGKAGISPNKIDKALNEYRGGIFSKDKPELLDSLLEDVAPAPAQQGGMVTVTHRATGKSQQYPANSRPAILARQKPNEWDVK